MSYWAQAGKGSRRDYPIFHGFETTSRKHQQNLFAA